MEETKKCHICGKEISANAQYCENCGQKVINNEIIVEQVQKPTQISKKKKNNKIFIVFLLFAFIVCYGGIISIIKNYEPPEPYHELKEAISCETTEQAETIDKQLKKCGIEDYKSIEHDDSLDDINDRGEKGYRIHVDDDIQVIMYIDKNNKLYQLKYADIKLFKNGKAVSKLSDYILTINEITNLQLMCQKQVKSILKSPSTAKFPSYTKWNFIKNKEKITVQGYVDSQNSFGAELRSDFQIKIDKNTITSFIFDGEELINY